MDEQSVDTPTALRGEGEPAADAAAPAAEAAGVLAWTREFARTLTPGPTAVESLQALYDERGLPQ